MEKAMAPHSSTLAWRIPWTEEPGRLQSMGLLSQTRLSNFTFTFHFHALEKEMATHSSVLAWRIPGTREPGGLPSMGLHNRAQLKQISSSSSNANSSWNPPKKIAHNQKQRRSRNTMIGGVQSLLNQTSYPPEMLGRHKQNLACTRTEEEEQ